MAQNLELAIDGGTPVRTAPMPPRALLGEAEKAAAVAVFNEAIAAHGVFGYNGERERAYEAGFAELLGGGYADGVNSGTNAVFVALGALQLDALSEVIVPPITDQGGIMPVLFVGCVPVGADADPRTYNVSAEHIAPCITERTRAIVVAHIGGDAVDMAPVMALAREHGLYVVEDCAQSHGATCRDKPVGTFGHIAAFSTMSGKHHCTGAQGGVVYTQNEDLHWQAKRFADRGKPFNVENPTGNVVAGLNCNSNDLSAAIGCVQLKKLPGIIARRIAVGNAIRDALGPERAVRVGWQVPETQSVYWFLRMHIEPERLTVDKAQFCAALNAEGIPAYASYRHLPGEHPWFRNKTVFGKSGFPWDCSDYTGPRTPQAAITNAIRAAEEHFNIPVHESYGDDEVRDILEALAKVEAACAR